MPARHITASKLEEPFQLEEHLLEVVYGQLPDLLVGRSRHIMARSRKFAVGAIIPDLVIVSLVTRRNHLVKPKRISMTDSAVFSAIHDSAGMTKEKLAERFFAREALITQSVGRLVKLGLVARRKDMLLANGRSIARGARIVSVEAKLTRWREAIEQAKAYLQFSNSAYVALPYSQIERVKEIRQACKVAEVGLVAVSRSACKVVVRAPVFHASSGEWFWLLNKTIGLGS